MLVNKLHEYLAHSTIEDKHNAASQDVDGTVFNYPIYERVFILLTQEIKVFSGSQVWQIDALQKTQQVELWRR